MKFGVEILLKDEVLDSQGRAVLDRLKADFNKLTSVRVGKYIVLDLAEENTQKAQEQIEKMCESLLVNSLIEKYKIQQLKDGQ